MNIEARLKDCMWSAIYTIRATPPKMHDRNVTADRKYWRQMLEGNFPDYTHLIDWYNVQVERVIYGKQPDR